MGGACEDEGLRTAALHVRAPPHCRGCRPGCESSATPAPCLSLQRTARASSPRRAAPGFGIATRAAKLAPGVVTVQVGQCGNQLGTALFNALVAEAGEAGNDFGAATRQARPAAHTLRLPSLTFPRRRISGSEMASTLLAQYWLTWSPRRAAGGCTAAQLLLTRTSQVVAAAVRGTPQRGWAFNERAALTFESGSGNNWARGYNTYGPRFRSRACELLRREVRAGAAAAALYRCR